MNNVNKPPPLLIESHNLKSNTNYFSLRFIKRKNMKVHCINYLWQRLTWCQKKDEIFILLICYFF